DPGNARQPTTRQLGVDASTRCCRSLTNERERTLALVSMRPAPRRARFMRSAPRIGSVEATLKRLADGLLAPEALPTMNRHIADDGAGWRGPRGVFRSIPSKESTNEHERHTARRVAVHHDER